MSLARLHVMTATETPYAVVLRRGPTGQVASLGWDRASGEVVLGQWFRGRIYEHRSDLSPDGRHMIYFAYKGGRGPGWTVVSRAPWLAALAWLPQDHTWHGGGAFTADGRVFRNGGGDVPDIDGLTQAPPDAMPHGTDGFHMGGLYVAMMERRGWVHAGGERYEARLARQSEEGWSIGLGFETWAKRRSLIANRYSVTAGDVTVAQQDWEWAETWRDGVQFAEGGCLWFARVGAGARLHDRHLIADLNPMRFEAREAPYRGAGQ